MASTASPCDPWYRELTLGGLICSLIVLIVCWLFWGIYEMLTVEIPIWRRYQKEGIPITGTIVERHCSDCKSHYTITIECQSFRAGHSLGDDGDEAEATATATRQSFTELIHERAIFPRDYEFHSVGNTVPCIILPGDDPSGWKRQKDVLGAGNLCSSLCTTVFVAMIWIPLLSWGAWNLAYNFWRKQQQQECSSRILVQVAWVVQFVAIVLLLPAALFVRNRFQLRQLSYAYSPIPRLLPTPTTPSTTMNQHYQQQDDSMQGTINKNPLAETAVPAKEAELV